MEELKSIDEAVTKKFLESWRDLLTDQTNHRIQEITEEMSAYADTHKIEWYITMQILRMWIQWHGYILVEDTDASTVIRRLNEERKEKLKENIIIRVKNALKNSNVKSRTEIIEQIYALMAQRQKVQDELITAEDKVKEAQLEAETIVSKARKDANHLFLEAQRRAQEIINDGKDRAAQIIHEADNLVQLKMFDCSRVEKQIEQLELIKKGLLSDPVVNSNYEKKASRRFEQSALVVTQNFEHFGRNFKELSELDQYYPANIHEGLERILNSFSTDFLARACSLEKEYGVEQRIQLAEKLLDIANKSSINQIQVVIGEGNYGKEVSKTSWRRIIFSGQIFVDLIELLCSPSFTLNKIDFIYIEIDNYSAMRKKSGFTTIPFEDLCKWWENLLFLLQKLKLSLR